MKRFTLCIFLAPLLAFSQVNDIDTDNERITATAAVKTTVVSPEHKNNSALTTYLPTTVAMTTDRIALENNADISIIINNLSPYQVVQRDASGNANILVQGLYVGNPASIQARWNGNPTWTTLTIDANGVGTFSGILANQFQGQGLLEVRFSDTVNITDTVQYVGIGDIFIIAGQSNASGRGTTLNTYTHERLKASLFGNDDLWKELIDKVDDDNGQIDSVSSDAIAGGSPWPLVASRIMESQNVPVAFIPAAKGGTIMLQWRAAANPSEPTTLYGSMNRRITAVGGEVKAILFFQGESDALFETSQAFYTTELNTFVNNIAANFPGLKTMIGQIGHSDLAGNDAIRAAQIEVLSSNDNAILGPVTYDINLSDEDGDTLHFKSDPDMATYARRWYKAIDKAFYDGTNGYGPVVDQNAIVYNISSNKVTIPFNDATTPIIDPASTVATTSFNLINNEELVSIASINIVDNTIELTPSTTLNIEQPISLSYASNNDGVDAAIYDTESLPAQNFYNLNVDSTTLGVVESDFESTLSVYPNPTDGHFSIDLGANYQSVTIKIISQNGKLIQSNSYEKSQLLHFDISIVSTGMYVVLIESGNKKFVTKLVKQ